MFSYWPQMDEKEVGNDGYFFVFENTKASSLPWYETHYLESSLPILSMLNSRERSPFLLQTGVPVKYALIFKGINYNGNLRLLQRNTNGAFPMGKMKKVGIHVPSFKERGCVDGLRER